MKVLVLTNSISGIVQFRLDLMRSMTAEGYSVLISCPQEYRYEHYESILKKEGCSVIRCDFARHGMNPVKELRLLASYRRLMKKERPGAVLTYTIKPNVYGGMAAAGLGIPCIGNVTGLGVAIENPGILRKVTLFLYKAGFGKAKRVFFQNSENRDFFVKEGIIDKSLTSVLPGSGVDLSEHTYRPYPEGDGIKLLYIGRQTKDKGYGELVRAAMIVKKKRPETEFISLGLCEDEFREEHDRLRASKWIREEGFKEDVRPYIEDCSALILPSYHEGMSNVLLEAAAAGRPVIATDVPGCRETYVDNVTGFSCKKADPDSLAAAIEKLIALTREEREEMGKKGRKYVEEHFDRKKVTESYMTELRRLPQ